jgi:hypothetical protein
MNGRVAGDEADSEIWRLSWRLVKRTVMYGGKCDN